MRNSEKAQRWQEKQMRTYKKGHIPRSYEPYVQLKSGLFIPLDSVRSGQHGVNLYGQLNDSVNVRKKDIRFYSNGDNTYYHVRRNIFAPMTDEGRINVFTQYTDRYINGHYSQVISGRYVQDSGALNAYHAKYRHLKTMMPLGTPARAELDRFHRNQWLAAIPMIVGFACIGVAPYAVGRGDFDTGPVLLFGGMCLTVTSPIIMHFHAKRKWKAVGIHNGVESP